MRTTRKTSGYFELLRGCTTLAVALAAACGGKQSGPVKAGPVPVVVAEAVRKTMPVEVRAVGTVEPVSTVAVKARVGGTLERVHFAEGQEVTAGQLLFTIDEAPFEAALRQAEAGLARDRALLAKAEADAARFEKLAADEFVSREQLDQARASVAALRASVQADEAALDRARLELGYCSITAPIGGRAGSLLVHAGNLVKANDERGLVVINQVRPIFVSFAVPAQHLGEILMRRAAGALRVRAALDPHGAESAEGTVTFLDNAVDQETGTVRIKAQFANTDGRLWPGQFMDVSLTLAEEKNRVVVPAAAVQSGQAGTYVFVVRDDAIAELRPVEVARMDDAEAVIASGLAGGERVVTDGHLRLLPGREVAIKRALPGAEEARP